MYECLGYIHRCGMLDCRVCECSTLLDNDTFFSSYLYLFIFL